MCNFARALRRRDVERSSSRRVAGHRRARSRPCRTARSRAPRPRRSSSGPIREQRDRNAAHHRLEHGQAEALRERGEDEAGRGPVQALELASSTQPRKRTRSPARSLSPCSKAVSYPGATSTGSGSAWTSAIASSSRSRFLCGRLAETVSTIGAAPRSERPPELRLRNRRDTVPEARAERRDVDPVALHMQVVGDVVLGGLGQGQDPPRAARGERDEKRDARSEHPGVRLRVLLVDHVEDRRHLGDARHRRRRVLDVVEQVDASPARGAWQQRLLGEHSPRAAARAHGDVHELDLGCPRLGRERRRRLVPGEHDELELPPGLEQRRNEPPYVQLAAAGLARDEV